ncbi:class I SAM-dependent methyltransferase [Psychroserpens ponticola]|uniref:Class I SAM-dependent methyltransferase n=1 Tax=Psychroserpens ponticola TaxID=2932268 RepID=A0ABY7RXF8_9FLAO|nr:class I SAM-dependent methyltransferase [Psychroserpens ponticola]WCO00375.1 class I SAM-dependent methyltransferase [Psychroserpens ponticola]
MNQSILHTEVQSYINSHLNDDITKLLLKGTQINGVNTKAIVEQIEAKLKSKIKLPTWFQTEGIYFPNKLNIEQTSSEITAKYKSELISGNNIIDITGGFGIDCHYFSKRFSKVIHCEINEELSHIVANNSKLLQSNNIEFFSTDGIAFLKCNEEIFDWIYIDPSRRHNQKGKVFFLEDCLPNVPLNLEFLFSKTDQILVKTSPLLDISIGLKELKHVESIHIVSVKNEVKELLWVLKKDYSGSIKVSTVDITNQKTEAFDFYLNEELDANPVYSEPLSYLYEPNVAIYKSGAFKLVSTKLNINKLHSNSHLYTSNTLFAFPGRRFQIDKVLPYHKQRLKKEHLKKANITIRNFPETVQNIRKKLDIKEGGNNYLFFTTNVLNEKIVLICSKVE